MNLSELRAKVRLRLRDTVKPYLVSDDEVDASLNEAEREAAFRALLIRDKTSPLARIEINCDETEYQISPRIIDVLGIAAESNANCAFTGWTLNESTLILDALPVHEDVLTLDCYRLPLRDMEDDDDEPEVRAIHHDRMIEWALSLCYLTPDADLFDQDASDRYADRFEQNFGERLSARTMTNHRSKTGKSVMGNGYM
jgi:hypothetical protein